MARILDDTQLAQVNKVLNKNGIVIFPTDTVYGMAVRLDSYTGWLKMIEIKKRPLEKSFPVMVNSIEMAKKIAYINNSAKKLLEEFAPGPLTVVVKSKNLVPEFLLGGKKTVAIRIPKSDLITDIISRLDSPLIVTSANISGEETPKSTQEIIDIFNDKVDIIITGICDSNRSSTIVDTTTNEIKILRVGDICEEAIHKVLLTEEKK